MFNCFTLSPTPTTECSMQVFILIVLQNSKAICKADEVKGVASGPLATWKDLIKSDCLLRPLNI